MARKTLEELRTTALRRADMETTSFISRAEANDYVNDGGSEFHDEFLVKTYRDHFRKRATIDLDGQVEAYQLPGDFLQLQQVFFLQGGIRYRLEMFMADELTDYEVHRILPIASGEYMRYRIMGTEILFTPRPNQGGTVELWYTPRYRELIDPLVDDGTGTLVNNPNYYPDADVIDIRVAPGWEEYITITAAIEMLSKEESETGPLERRLMGLKQRIKSVATIRDSGKPQRIRDTYGDRNRYPRRRRLY